MNVTTATVLIAFAVVPTLAANDARAAPFLPDFEAATFVSGAPINNPYFPLLDKKTRVFVGETPAERFELTVLGAGPIILGVQTTARRDRSFEDGLLVEDTFDYYAQDSIGNVWYFGEDVTNFHYDDEGNLIGTDSESAWRAGINGALPGYIMPVDLTVGFNYYQEFAVLDEALDQGLTFAAGQIVSIAIGEFSDVLQVLETSELEPDAREFKYYAPGVGLILVEEGLDANFQNPESTFELAATIPEGGTLALLGLGLSGMFAIRTRSRVGTYRTSS